MAEYKPYLDAFFVDAEQLMWELSETKHYFTNYEFIRRAGQRHQGAYVGLLKAVLDHRGEEYLFNVAHENLGIGISRIAQELNYRQEKNSGIYEDNIWGDRSKAIAYHRTENVKSPTG